MTARDNEKVSDERLIRDLDHAMRTGYIRPMLLTETIEHLRTSQEWQPIKSAPRDGRTLLLNRTGSTRVYTGRYVTCDASGWWLDTHGQQRDPSSWQPLPPPPKGEAP